MTARQQALDSAFALIEQAAIDGERCPKSRPHGPLGTNDSTALCRQGRIKIEVFGHNWRIATILVGPHAGKATQRPPNQWAHEAPYIVVGKETTRIAAQKRTNLTNDHIPARRQGPSKPKDYSGGGT